MGLSSLMMLCDTDRRERVELVWKVEGPGDMLALWASLPDDKRETVAVVTQDQAEPQLLVEVLVALLLSLNSHRM
jgi:hypothetical protein